VDAVAVEVFDDLALFEGELLGNRLDVDVLGVSRRRLEQRVRSAAEGSYTRRLLDDPALLDAKLREEADELATARGEFDVAAEAADLLYFTCVALIRSGATLGQVFCELERRALRVTRRPGDAKPGYRSCSDS